MLSLKIKENFAYFSGIFIAIVMFGYLVLMLWPFVEKGEVGLFLVLIVSSFVAWFAGFAAYLITLLRYSNADGKRYPFVPAFFRGWGLI